jgi:hypothetical protein
MLTASALLAASAEPPEPAQTHRFPFACEDVSRTAFLYFNSHGIFTRENRGMLTAEGSPFASLLVRTAPTRSGDLKPWTDALGNKISDFAVYWIYANRKDTEKIPFGVWHLRLGRYWLMGEMKLMPEDHDQGACRVDFKLNFEAGGANMVGFLGVDSQWSYGSNGRMEREYLDGISAELARRKESTTIE